LGLVGIFVNAVGDVDGDGLADVVVALDPCVEECSDERGVVVELYSSRADGGLLSIALEDRQEMQAARQRVLGARADDFDTPFSTGWALEARAGEIEARLVGRRIGRRWTLRLENDELVRTASDISSTERRALRAGSM
jgi:hypothetical protein